MTSATRFSALAGPAPDAAIAQQATVNKRIKDRMHPSQDARKNNRQRHNARSRLRRQELGLQFDGNPGASTLMSATVSAIWPRVWFEVTAMLLEYLWYALIGVVGVLAFDGKLVHNGRAEPARRQAEPKMTPEQREVAHREREAFRRIGGEVEAAPERIVGAGSTLNADGIGPLAAIAGVG